MSILFEEDLDIFSPERTMLFALSKLLSVRYSAPLSLPLPFFLVHF